MIVSVFQKLINNFRDNFDLVSYWFYKNYMVLNAGKCNFIILGNNTENENFLFNNILMKNNNEEKMLGLIIDNN